MATSNAKSRRAWLCAVMTAALTAMGMLVAWRMDRDLPTAPAWANLASSAIGFFSLIYLYLVRKTPNRRAMSWVYLLNSMSVSFAFYLSSNALAKSGLPWVPFQGNKLGVFIAALLAPSPFTAVVSIAYNTFIPVGQFAAFAEDVRVHIAFGEPWVMMAFGFAATIVMISRFARMRLEERFTLVEGEKQALIKSAAKFHSIKDLMNTPLQTLEIGLSLMSEERSDHGQVLQEMGRAVAALTRINDALSHYEKEGPATASEPLSFDAMKVLRQPDADRKDPT